MRKDYDVLCVGLVNVNFLAKPMDRGVFDVDVTLLDAVDAVPGGDALNEAVVLARLGNRTGLAGKIGGDDLGKTILAFLARENVGTENLKIDPGVKTSACLVLIDKNGNRNFATFRGANIGFSIEDIDLAVLGQTKIVNIGSMFALKSLDGSGAETLFREAKARGVITSADMKQDTYKIGLDGIRGVLRHTDYFLPSYDEAAYLTKEKDPVKMAASLLGTGAGTVVVKLGEKGCYAKTGKESFFVEAIETEAVDTTGAGDNFVAGFLTGAAKGWDLRSCCEFANAVGSLCVQKVGPTAAVESLEQALAYLKRHRPHEAHAGVL